ncbi:hypothetical protein [Cupriavidus basilensis]|uniref:hypothetical protein n=1 Tax=Cupriavidus basilensis TaxID=68895 RepID=UPI0020A655AA|nr:hypothetical protein [Cupriavidus basilensis]MCP3024975.1 hypothetical protein [Cupriavidus basilensis]
MNNQEFFTAALLHCRKQGIASIDNSGNCKYRGPNRLACAVGGILTDEEVQQVEVERGNIEGGTASFVLGYVPRLGNVSRGLADSIQAAHDHLMPAPGFIDVDATLPDPGRYGFAERSLANFNTRMREIANSYGLVFTEA